MSIPASPGASAALAARAAGASVLVLERSSDGDGSGNALAQVMDAAVEGMDAVHATASFFHPRS
ncbi:hypothetical protein [Croceicoccus mobilis]|uniref:Uncharacterized protein n=1 Tax=Croceicoccus mobilis TaxID=1703339 RepID=A0A916Z898_9SPHN|nr:hypothetical protein [Croceicoccus mobilis]GGD80877.1 hypothetical protein GCM10010990_33480 [Croceicoccus mobilis]